MTAHWAEHYLGKPWRSGATGPDAFDCYGLVRAVYADRYGHTMPVLDADATSALACLRAARDFPEYARWAEVATPGEGDVVQMGCARRPHHVGVFVDAAGGRVLHSVESAGVLLQPLSSLAAHGWNILNIYRRRAA